MMRALPSQTKRAQPRLGLPGTDVVVCAAGVVVVPKPKLLAAA